MENVLLDRLGRRRIPDYRPEKKKVHYHESGTLGVYCKTVQQDVRLPMRISDNWRYVTCGKCRLLKCDHVWRKVSSDFEGDRQICKKCCKERPGSRI